MCGTVVYAGVLLPRRARRQLQAQLWRSGHPCKWARIATYYAHNSQLLVGRARQVERGQALALSGSTGNSTGPHVHYETCVSMACRSIRWGVCHEWRRISASAAGAAPPLFVSDWLAAAPAALAHRAPCICPMAAACAAGMRQTYGDEADPDAITEQVWRAITDL